AIGGDFVPKKNDLICSAHFVHIDFLERPGASDVRLKNLAVPSVFLEAPTSDTCGCRLMSHIRTNSHAGYSYTHYYTRTVAIFLFPSWPKPEIRPASVLSTVFDEVSDLV
ncbi:hypothetical protein ALC62_13646, partial [Cyphomyrmex costatus]